MTEARAIKLLMDLNLFIAILNVLVCFLFVLLYRRRQWRKTTGGRYLMAAAIVGTVFFIYIPFRTFLWDDYSPIFEFGLNAVMFILFLGINLERLRMLLVVNLHDPETQQKASRMWPRWRTSAMSQDTTVASMKDED